MMETLYQLGGPCRADREVAGRLEARLMRGLHHSLHRSPPSHTLSPGLTSHHYTADSRRTGDRATFAIVVVDEGSVTEELSSHGYRIVG